MTSGNFFSAKFFTSNFLFTFSFMALSIFLSMGVNVVFCPRAYAALPSGVISEDEGIADPRLAKERRIGREAVRQIEERYELIADPARIALLSMIVSRLSPHMTRKIPYEVRILRMDVPNAFCLPGGFIFFTSKMLERLRSDAEIAAVMAHEMIHVDQSHGLKMAAKSNKISLAALAVMVLSGGAMAPVVLAQVAQVAMTSAYTIEFEKEADSMGLDVLIASGYPPTAMVTIMEGFMHEEMKQPIREYGIYMDHPESAERVEAMSNKLKSLNIKLKRKHVLHLLVTSIDKTGSAKTDKTESDGQVRLLVDGLPVWSGPQNDRTLEALTRAREILDRDFQMELAPYDLQLEGDGLLRLGNAILAQAPLPEGMQDLRTFRENLLSALAQAQIKYPIARYFR
ncbi:MAG: M48 family metalloprotease [Synergistaceae bacterium]|nr:M48 family metalloprotease [Synergistaceae bacterium]